ncbi:MAG: UvrD-helicase domain-containing protein [Victivallales bacterium]|nr:UvrD-helicase domain-containing protein [Victivallales bacterium]
MGNFDSMKCELDGCSLIEASAGTGKTYTIETLYLRLLLEKKLPVEQILVVTFTKLATAELQERLRGILTAARDCLRQPDNPEIPSRLTGFVEKWHAEAAAEGVSYQQYTEEKCRLCERALSQFEQAPISTIHGFCQQILQDNAFESGVRFGRELLDDEAQQEILDRGFADFFRQQCYDSNHPLRAWLMTEPLGITKPDELKNTLKKVVTDVVSDEKIDGGTDALSGKPEDILEETELQFESWLGWRPGRSWFDAEPSEPEMEEFRLALKSFAALPKGRDSKSKLATCRLMGEEGWNYTGALGELAWRLRRYKAAMLRLAKRRVIRFFLGEKSRRNFFTYDDLLNEVSRQLSNPKMCMELQKNIRRKFPCAIIDEFQDTDPVQNSIFARLYMEDEPSAPWPADAPVRTFFMIGDPKQAIYGFRGGDLPAYMKAKQEIPPGRCHSLNTNFRSSRQYIAAMNRLFDRSSFFTRFGLESAVLPAENAPKLLFHGQEWKFGTQALISKKSLPSVTAACQELAVEIRRLVELGVLVRIQGKEHQLNFGDIAVLVRGNKTLRIVETTLNNEHIPCSAVGNISVFSRPQAGILRQFLEGVQNASHLPTVVRVMAMPIFVFSPAQIDEMVDGAQPHFQEWLHGLKEIWFRRSFLAMFDEFLGTSMAKMLGDAVPEELSSQRDCTVAEMIAGGEEGREGLAIYRQLAELLHAVAQERRLGGTALLNYLDEQMAHCENANGEPAETEVLRMTTQEPAVRLMTMHKSKGLQFPFVFVFSFLNKKVGGHEPESYHTALGERRYLVDVSLEDASDSEHRKQGRLESAEEELRLFYVAVTRARFFVRFLDGRPSESSFFNVCLSGRRVQAAEKSESADKGSGVLGGPEAAKPGDDLMKLSNWPDVTGTLMELEEFPGKGEQGEELQAVAQPSPNPPTSGAIHEEFPQGYEEVPGWMTNSFTGLSSFSDEARNQLKELMKDDDDTDAMATDGEDLEERLKMPMVFRLPHGVTAGTRWHLLFEELDFQAEEKTLIEELLPAQFREQGLLRRGNAPVSPMEMTMRQNAAIEMVRGVLWNPLPVPLAPGERPAFPSRHLDFCLRDVDREHRRAELRFTYWMRRGKEDGRLLGGLGAALARHGIAVPAAWECHPAGALTGSIDLLFRGPDQKYYLLDWKTNAIGNDFRNFSYDGMKGEMDRHFYHLQYLIYIVAFLQFHRSLNPTWELTPSNYDELFGGVFYVFLRGVSPASADRGFFAVRPDYELVRGVFEQLDVCPQN